MFGSLFIPTTVLVVAFGHFPITLVLLALVVLVAVTYAIRRRKGGAQHRPAPPPEEPADRARHGSDHDRPPLLA